MDCFRQMVGQINYQRHPSPELVTLFQDNPYQGQNPNRANLIILGTDANYSPMICNHRFSSLFFKRILDYHSNGIGFWEQTGVHHPFLLQEYPFDRRKDGVKYHTNFRKLQLRSEHAQYISFVELLDIPTIGNTGEDRTLFRNYLNQAHLEGIENIIADDARRRFILINQTLISELQYIRNHFGCFNSLFENIGEAPPLPGIAFNDGTTLIYNGYSFSHSITDEYIANLRREIIQFLPELA